MKVWNALPLKSVRIYSIWYSQRTLVIFLILESCYPSNKASINFSMSQLFDCSTWLRSLHDMWKEDFYSLSKKSLGSESCTCGFCWNVYCSFNVCSLRSFIQLPLLARIRSLVGIYAIFRFKRMHSLSLGLPEMLKECIFKYLSDSEKAHLHIRIAHENQCPFWIQKVVLKRLNLFLQEAEGTTFKNGLIIAFSKVECPVVVSILFTECGTLCMLNATD